jgi:hypothetical protein
LKDVEAAALISTAARRAPKLCHPHAVKFLASLFGSDVRRHLIGDTMKGWQRFDINKSGRGRLCVAVNLDGSPCRSKALHPKTVIRHQQAGEPFNHGYCRTHMLQMIRHWHRHHGRAPLLSGRLHWQDLPGIQRAKQCTAKVKDGYRWRQCKRPATRGFWTTDKSGKPKFQLLRRPVCSKHGAPGAAHGYLSQTIKRTQLERDRLAREQRLNSKRHMAALKERVAAGGLVGVRRPQATPASSTPIGDEFFGGRAERSEPLAPLYPTGLSRLKSPR